LIATINASMKYRHQTLSTLQFASRAKLVENKAVVNVERRIELEEELESVRQDRMRLDESHKKFVAKSEAEAQKLRFVFSRVHPHYC
jgi:hypothetical protein